MRYADWMRAAAEEYRRLDALLRDLDADDWRRPTDCPGWDVRAMVAHLVGAAEGTASVRETARQVRLARRLGRRGDLVDRINEVQVTEREHREPDDLVHDLLDAGRRGVARRTRLPRAVAAVRVPFGPPLGVRSIGYLMGRIYTRDAWMHRVDISRAADRDLHLTVEHDGSLVADLVQEWAAAHGAAYDLVLTGVAGGRWGVEGGPRIELDAVEFARTLAGRAPATGLLGHGVPF